MIYPMFAMVLLTVIVMCLAVATRVASVRNGLVPGKYYRLMQGAELPDNVVKTGRSFVNQFEVPLLFYVAAAIYLLGDTDTGLALPVAWAFVISRIIHAAIHLTYNHVLHRLAVFVAGVICVLVLWIDLLRQFS